jgi:predicted NAD/FAD-binding protein
VKIAVIGAGIAGNITARGLHYAGHDITVYEAAGHVGGHTHTHEVDFGGERQHVDTGFIVYNNRTYPGFSALLAELGVETQPAPMSFSVRSEKSGLEYNGTSLDGLFAQRRNLLRPSFHRMLLDILRFGREAPALLAQDESEIALGEHLARARYSRGFVEDYLLPMGAAIWSTDPARMLDFPARFFVRFLHNHGMLAVNGRPQWRTVRGGSARYVERLVAPFRDRIRLHTPVEEVRRTTASVFVRARGAEAERYDHAFLACHADQALRMLADATPLEREVLGAIPYQENEAVLHTDASVLPRSRRAWAAWNYRVLPQAGQRVAVTYNMNLLQRLESRHTWCVTLNDSGSVNPRQVVRRMVYHHPVFTPAGVAAQRRQREVSGVHRTWFCGAYWRHGFHEDGLASAVDTLRHFEAETLRRFEEAGHAQRPLSRVA